MMKKLQNLGKALMQPVAILPVAALLMGIVIGLTQQAGVLTTSLQHS